MQYRASACQSSEWPADATSVGGTGVLLRPFPEEHHPNRLGEDQHVENQ